MADEKEPVDKKPIGETLRELAPKPADCRRACEQWLQKLLPQMKAAAAVGLTLIEILADEIPVLIRNVAINRPKEIATVFSDQKLQWKLYWQHNALCRIADGHWSLTECVMKECRLQRAEISWQ